MGNCVNCYDIDLNKLEQNLGIFKTMKIKITSKINLDSPVSISDTGESVSVLEPGMIIDANDELINTLSITELKHKSHKNYNYSLYEIVNESEYQVDESRQKAAQDLLDNDAWNES